MPAAKHFFMEPFCELCHTGDQKSSITFHSKSVRLILRARRGYREPNAVGIIAPRLTCPRDHCDSRRANCVARCSRDAAQAEREFDSATPM
jgi:hypothetical protein